MSNMTKLYIRFAAAVRFKQVHGGKQVGAFSLSYPLARLIVAMGQTTGNGRFENDEASVSISGKKATVVLPATPKSAKWADVRDDDDDLLTATFPITALKDAFDADHLERLGEDHARLQKLLKAVGDAILKPID